jgi:DNA-directed RNA polymerase specialized sigma24 family protein
MSETRRKPTDAERQLEDLLKDPDYARILTAVTSEIERRWCLAHTDACCTVLSAIGEPKELASIYDAMRQVRRAKEKLTLDGDPGKAHALATVIREKTALARLITRRRTIDLLRKDAARQGHDSFFCGVEDENDTPVGSIRAETPADPEAHVQRVQLKVQFQRALRCFGSQDDTARKRADLLRRRELEDTDYEILSNELGCPVPTLHVRVHAAKCAFFAHIRKCEHCHPELIEWLSR